MDFQRNNKLIKIGFVFLLIVALIICRLLFLIVIKGEDYIAMAQSSRLKTIAVNQFERGTVLDCNGIPLTDIEENCLVVFPCLVSDYNWLENVLSDNLVGDEKNLTDDWQAEFVKNIPYVVQRNLSDSQVVQYNKMIENYGLTGVFVLTLEMRYGDDNLASHILGFVGEADEEDIKELENAGFDKNTYVGKSGIEFRYNKWLMGDDSDEIGVVADERSTQVDNELRLIKGKENEGWGYDVQLTINKDYQKFLENAMEGKSGGAVLMNVENGDIAAIASAPNYNQYEGQKDTEGNDYINKAFAYYPPASVFKTVLVLAALEQGTEFNNSFFCNGKITLYGGHTVGCWNENGHGYEDLSAALSNSCNPYFVELGQKLGGKTIMDFAYNLGLGEQKVIGYNVVSTDENISFNTGALADIANASIGENGVRLSPLLVAQLMCTVANGGNVFTPRLVKGILTEQGEYVKEYESSVPRKVATEENCKTLTEYLEKAVTEGTGMPVNSNIVKIAGKTGTSQDAGVWFAGFMPADNPEYAIAVYIENGNSGGSDAGTVAKSVFEKIAVIEGL